MYPNSLKTKFWMRGFDDAADGPVSEVGDIFTEALFDTDYTRKDHRIENMADYDARIRAANEKRSSLPGRVDPFMHDYGGYPTGEELMQAYRQGRKVAKAAKKRAMPKDLPKGWDTKLDRQALAAYRSGPWRNYSPGLNRYNPDANSFEFPEIWMRCEEAGAQSQWVSGRPAGTEISLPWYASTGVVAISWGVNGNIRFGTVQMPKYAKFTFPTAQEVANAICADAKNGNQNAVHTLLRRCIKK